LKAIREEVEHLADERGKEAAMLAMQIMPLLAGRDPMVQSATLADLTSMHLAGIFAASAKGEVNERETRKMREGMFALFCKTVWRLLPLNEETTRAMLAEKAKHGRA
jgi:hypothetical protein